MCKSKVIGVKGKRKMSRKNAILREFLGDQALTQKLPVRHLKIPETSTAGPQGLSPFRALFRCRSQGHGAGRRTAAWMRSGYLSRAQPASIPGYDLQGAKNTFNYSSETYSIIAVLRCVLEMRRNDLKIPTHIRAQRENVLADAQRIRDF